MSPQDSAKFIRDALPPGGLFAGMEWKVPPAPFPLGENLAKEIESLGRVLLQFYRAVNLLYRKSVEGKQPDWVARWLDLGKPRELIELQRSAAFKNDVPRVIRPDILLTENGFSITELDSVPGGIGLTAWLNQTYSILGQASRLSSSLDATGKINWTGGTPVHTCSAARTECCAGLNPSLAMPNRFTSSFPKRRQLIGRKWNGSPDS